MRALAATVVTLCLGAAAVYGFLRPEWWFVVDRRYCDSVLDRTLAAVFAVGMAVVAGAMAVVMTVGFATLWRWGLS